MNGSADDLNSELIRLRAENARLTALLDAYSIEWRTAEPPQPSNPLQERSRITTEEKIALFRRLFRG